jgi:hypothetical protein
MDCLSFLASAMTVVFYVIVLQNEVKLWKCLLFIVVQFNKMDVFEEESDQELYQY